MKTFSNFFHSARKLCETSKAIDDFTIVARGLKLQSPDEETETSDIRKNEEHAKNLYSLLGLERVALASKRSRGIYEADQKRILLTSLCGKMMIGYSENSNMYLRPIEALYLMEMNRLEVEFDCVVMSIEQAYAIFLDPCNGVTLEMYIAYSYLNRAGYLVFHHDSEKDTLEHKASEERKIVNKDDEMVWMVLNEQLNLPVSLEFINSERDLYEATKSSMKSFCEMISGKRLPEVINQVESAKRSLSPNSQESCAKKFKTETQEENFLDILKNEVEYYSYCNTFKNIDIIKRSEKRPTTDRQLQIHFDVFLPKSNFKRTEDLPNYRLVVIKTSQSFPSNQELEELKTRPKYPLPIIVAIVSESMTINFCSCTL